MRIREGRRFFSGWVDFVFGVLVFYKWEVLILIFLNFGDFVDNVGGFFLGFVEFKFKIGYVW